MSENGAGENVAENGNGDFFPAKSPERRLSGFARKGYWDEPDDDDPSITRRQAKSIWAKEKIKEGLIGGARPGAGRPRKNKPLAEVVTELASEPKNADIIAKELINMAKNNPSASMKLGAIDRINKFEQDLEKNMRDDEKEARKLHGEALDMALAEALSEHGIGIAYDHEVSPEDVEDV